MTWRERFLAARERHRFADDDLCAWSDPHACPAAEAYAAVGLGTLGDHQRRDGNCSRAAHPDCVWSLGDGFEAFLRLTYLSRAAAAAAERLLDEIEDECARIKRELVA